MLEHSALEIMCLATVAGLGWKLGCWCIGVFDATLASVSEKAAKRVWAYRNPEEARLVTEYKEHQREAQLESLRSATRPTPPPVTTPGGYH